MMSTILPPSSRAITSRFHGQILRQVYRVWLFRKLAPTLVAEIIILSALLYGVGRMVFVERIIVNALNVFFLNPSQIFSFFVSAFAHAYGLTRFLAILVLVLVALLIRHITQGILRFILVKQNYFSSVSAHEGMLYEQKK